MPQCGSRRSPYWNKETKSSSVKWHLTRLHVIFPSRSFRVCRQLQKMSSLSPLIVSRRDSRGITWNSHELWKECAWMQLDTRWCLRIINSSIRHCLLASERGTELRPIKRQQNAAATMRITELTSSLWGTRRCFHRIFRGKRTNVLHKESYNWKPEV